MRAILTYHSIDSSGSPISIDEPTFRRHVRWIVGSGVPVLGLEEMLRMPEGSEALAVTFDDAFTSFETIAWPLLRDHAIPTTLFVATAHVGGSNAWRGTNGTSIPRLPILGWDPLARLAAEGVALGGHSRSHPDLRSVSDTRLSDEIEGCAEDLSQVLGRPPEAFAYPYGAHDRRVAEAVGGSFSIACTTALRTLRCGDPPLRLPRLDAFYFRENRRLERWGAPGFRRHLAFRAVARRFREYLLGF